MFTHHFGIEHSVWRSCSLWPSVNTLDVVLFPYLLISSLVLLSGETFRHTYLRSLYGLIRRYCGLVLAESFVEIVLLNRFWFGVVNSDTHLFSPFQDFCNAVCTCCDRLLAFIDSHHCTVVEESILLDFSLDLSLNFFNVWLEHLNYIAVSIVASIIFQSEWSKGCSKVDLLIWVHLLRHLWYTILLFCILVRLHWHNLTDAWLRGDKTFKGNTPGLGYVSKWTEGCIIQVTTPR